MLKLGLEDKTLLIELAKRRVLYSFHAKLAAVSAHLFIFAPGRYHDFLFSFHKDHVFSAHSHRVRAERIMSNLIERDSDHGKNDSQA